MTCTEYKRNIEATKKKITYNQRLHEPEQKHRRVNDFLHISYVYWRIDIDDIYA